MIRGIPSYNPIQFEPEQIVPTYTPNVDTRQPPAPDVPKTPDIPKTPAATAKVECPTKVQQAQEPVGTYVEGFRKKVIGYELIDNTCVQLTEKVPLPQQIVAGLPSVVKLYSGWYRGYCDEFCTARKTSC